VGVVFREMESCVMQDPRIEKLADVLVGYSAGVKKGDVVGIMGEPEAGPLIEAIAAAVVRAGGDPIWLPRNNHFAEVLLTHGTDEQVSRCHPVYMDYIKKVDVHFSMWAEVNTKSLSRYDPRRTALLQQARRPFLATFMERSAKKELRWCGTQFPTNAHAQDAEMSLSQYEEFVYRAGLLHMEDPAAEWRKIEARQQKICDFLQTKKGLRFRAPAVDGAGYPESGNSNESGLHWDMVCDLRRCAGHSRLRRRGRSGRAGASGLPCGPGRDQRAGDAAGEAVALAIVEEAVEVADLRVVVVVDGESKRSTIVWPSSHAGIGEGGSGLGADSMELGQ
jgi:hypothetical protein